MRRHLLLAVALVTAPAAARAQSFYTWNNSGTDWASPNSWTAGGPPTAADIAIFSQLGSGPTAVSLGSSQSVAGLVLDTASTGVGYTVTGSAGATLTIDNPNTAGFAQSVPGAMTVSGGTHTLNSLSLVISGSPFDTAVEIAASGTLALGRGTSVTLSNPAAFVQLRGAGARLVFDASTGTGAVPTLTGGQGIRFNGGGTVELRGATAGTAFTLPALAAGPGDATVFMSQPSGATGPTTASAPSLVRADPAATVFFATPGLSSLTLGTGGNNPAVTFTTAPAQSNGLITAVAGQNVPYVIVTRTPTNINYGTFATYGPNGVTAATLATSSDLSGVNATQNVDFVPTGNVTLTGPVSVNTLTIDQTGNPTLDLGAFHLTTNGLIKSGPSDFTITSSGGGALFGTSTAIREIAVLDQNYALITSAPLNAATAPVNKAGPGFLILTNTTTDQLAFSPGTTRVNITGGVLRVPAVFVNSTGNVFALRGGVLEVDGGGSATTFTRPLGTAAGSVNWRTDLSTTDAGSGGFSAVNGNLTVAIGGVASPTALVWADANTVNGQPGATPSFLLGSSALVIGSLRSNANFSVVWTNPLALDNGTAPLPSSQRELRVSINSNANFTAVITGTAATGLLKTGGGTLYLLANNTYAGPTVITGGRVLANGQSGSNSGTGTGLVTVAGPATNPASVGGNGRIGGDVLVTANNLLIPGDTSVGTLSVGGTVTIAPLGTWRTFVRVSGMTPVVNNPLKLDTATAALNLTSGSILFAHNEDPFSPSAKTVWTIATLVSGANEQLDGVGVPEGFVFGTYQNGAASGPVTISPAAFSIPSGGSMVLSRSGNTVILTFNPTPVPEPASVTAVCLGWAAGYVVFRRRRVLSHKARTGSLKPTPHAEPAVPGE
jgi:autotransporter-associated beta strand protein